MRRLSYPLVVPTTTSTPVGKLLRRWRSTRHLSQLALATEAEVSARHLSFIETGRSQPSKEMLLCLAEALELPLRERNALLSAGGFAPAFRETKLEDPAMEQARRSLDLILRQHEPFGAVVMNRGYDLLRSNDAASRMTALLTEDIAAVLADGPPNLLRLLLHPKGMRGSIVNWEQVAQLTAARALRELRNEGKCPAKETVERALRYPGVPSKFREVDVGDAPPLLVPTHLRKGDLEFKLLSTVMVLGTAQDITLQELQVETFFPADEASETCLRQLAGAAAGAGR